MSEVYKPMTSAPRNGELLYLRVRDDFGEFILKQPCRWGGKGWVTPSGKPLAPTPIGWKRNLRRYGI